MFGLANIRPRKPPLPQHMAQPPPAYTSEPPAYPAAAHVLTPATYTMSRPLHTDLLQDAEVPRVTPYLSRQGDPIGESPPKYS